jgi:hypothetical protein
MVFEWEEVIAPVLGSFRVARRIKAAKAANMASDPPEALLAALAVLAVLAVLAALLVKNCPLPWLAPFLTSQS